MGGGRHLAEAGPPPCTGPRFVRWIAIAFAVSVFAFVLGTVVEGFWGGKGGETNWVDQTFGFAMYLGAAVAALCVPVLVLSLLVAGAARLRRRRGRNRG
jgi:hypothetical protein